MEMFYATLGLVGAICAGVVFLKLFFMATGFLEGRTRGQLRMSVQQCIPTDKLVDIHIGGGPKFERLRFVGFLQRDAKRNNGIPFQFREMLVCESPNGSRILIRADKVRVIEESA